MGRSPCCSKEGLNRGAWTATEDQTLTDYIKIHGEGKWRNVPKKAGLKRCGKSCRLRWLNYLRPDIKRGNISHDEEELIIRLHKLLGNRWSLIAGRLPGRTDNEIKNYWNTNIGKKLQDHQSRSSSSQKPSYQCREKTSIAIEKSTSQSPEADNDSILVRTKASKCNKVVIPPMEPQNFDQDQLTDTKQPVAGPSVVNGSGDDHNVKEPEPLPEFDLLENNLSDFMMDLQMDEHLLSFLNTDFSELSYFEDSGGPSNTTGTCDEGSCLIPSSNQTFLFPDEKKPHDSDFPSMDALIGFELEWFRD